MATTKTVALKELRQNMDHYAQEVQKGKSFLVLKRSRPLFTMTAPDDDDTLWETVVDFTQIKKGGVPAEDVLAYL